MTESDTTDRRRGGGLDRIRVLIVDDHALFRAGIGNVLAKEKDLEVVGEASDGRSAIEAANSLSPNIVLMDLSLPQPGGIETTQRIRRELPATAVIVMAVDEDEERARLGPVRQVADERREELAPDAAAADENDSTSHRPCLPSRSIRRPARANGRGGNRGSRRACSTSFLPA